MIELPKIKNVKQKTKKYLFSFGGINKTEEFKAGELETSSNICFDSFPALSVRNKRVKTSYGTAEDLFYAKGMVKVYGTTETTDETTGEVVTTCKIAYRNETDTGNWSKILALTGGEKEIVALGNIIAVFPDKKYIDLTSGSWKNMEGKIDIKAESATVWHDRIKLSSTDFYTFKNTFKVGDVVTVLGGYYENNDTVRTDGVKIIRDISSNTDRTVTFAPYSFKTADGNYSASMSFSKTVPTLTKLCVWNDRLWGIDEDNNICASKHMDPTNFEYFDLSSADSFSIETSTTGDFTAAFAMSNHIAFFKENKIHRITGTKPSNYRHTIIDTRGVKKGSGRSLALIDDVLYYEGTDGIYAYNGSEARNVSEKLGSFTHSDGVGGASGKNYYISLKNGDDEYTLYCYDTEKNTWLRDDSTQMKAAFNFLGKLHYLSGEGNICSFESEKTDTAGFSVTLREITEKFSEQKGFSRLYLGYSMKEGGSIKAEVCYDFGDNFETAAVFTDHKKTVSEIRLVPNRSDFIRIRLTATPDVVLRSVMREYYTHGTLF